MMLATGVKIRDGMGDRVKRARSGMERALTLVRAANPHVFFSDRIR